jgi:putative membrane protein
MQILKITCIVVLLVVAAVFTYQNTAVMQLKFLFWSISMSSCLMLLTVLLVGIIIGLLFSFLKVRRKVRKVKKVNRNRFSELF